MEKLTGPFKYGQPGEKFNLMEPTRHSSNNVNRNPVQLRFRLVSRQQLQNGNPSIIASTSTSAVANRGNGQSSVNPSDNIATIDAQKSKNEKSFEDSMKATKRLHETLEKLEKQKNDIFAEVNDQLKSVMAKNRKLESELREQKSNHEQEIGRLNSMIDENKTKMWCCQCLSESHLTKVPSFCGPNCLFEWYFDIRLSFSFSKDNHLCFISIFQATEATSKHHQLIIFNIICRYFS